VVEQGASKTAGSEFGDCHALERLSPVGFDVPPAAPWSLAIRKSESVAGPKAQAPNAFARRGMGRAFSPRAFVIINLGRWPGLVWSRAFGPVDARNANMDQFTPAASSAGGQIGQTPACSRDGRTTISPLRTCLSAERESP
jgi:hypothetical protein